ncbi:uncharacterized protein LOC141651857 [Silene latifolia]|uniref:uncharacterized protein LOC141651857 n=1 Tax=Silene latifolia TaxID=37657 RepID=UPI003D76D347
MNAQKFCAYFNGVKTQLKKEILAISGFKEGTLPFKYLGVAITAGRLKKKDCAGLVDKIVERIRSLGAQRLSYAGRLVLVNSVLTSMYTYWASMFVLPKGVMSRVDAICRSFLWEGRSEYSRVPLLGWAKVCVPLNEGGLGIKQSHIWNKASIGKLACPPADSSWHWRKVCNVKDLIKEGFVDGQWSIGSRGFTVKGCYEWLRDKRVQVDWHKAVWCSMALPKHSFIAWLISNNALLLKDKLAHLQISQDDLCCLCQSDSETHKHLIEECHFSKSLLRGTGLWLESDIDQKNVLNAIARKRWSAIRKKLYTSAVLACWYMVWMQRNGARMHGSVTRPELVVQQIRRMIVSRFHECKPRVVNPKDRIWLCKVQLI